MKTVLVGFLWSSLPPMTIVVFDESCTAVQQLRGCGRSPVVILTQELVRGKKMLTAGEGGVSGLIMSPPTANKLPLRLAAPDAFCGVSGRGFQTDVWLAD